LGPSGTSVISRMLILKNDLHSELNLTRRTRFTGSESRIRNPSERRCAHHVSWLTDVRVIEEVENLGAKFH